MPDLIDRTSRIVRVEHSLGHERENREDPDGPGVIDDHEDDHFSEAYLEIEAGDGIEVDCYHARNPEGEHPFDQLDIDHCRAPGTSFNNRGRYNLYTQHIAGDPDFIQAIARGPLDPHVTVGDWSLFPRVGSFGTLTNFDVSCIDPDRESLPLNGQAIITVRDGDHIQVEEVAAGAMRNGSISLPEPIEIHPGDVLDIELIASDLDLEENETTEEGIELLADPEHLQQLEYPEFDREEEMEEEEEDEEEFEDVEDIEEIEEEEDLDETEYEKE